MNSCSVTNDSKRHILIKEIHTALTRDPQADRPPDIVSSSWAGQAQASPRSLHRRPSAVPVTAMWVPEPTHAPLGLQGL